MWRPASSWELVEPEDDPQVQGLKGTINSSTFDFVYLIWLSCASWRSAKTSLFKPSTLGTGCFALFNAADRLISNKRKFDHITPVLREQLHWLPIRQRIEFKIAVFVRNAVHGWGPTHLSRTCNPVRDVDARAHLRYAVRGDLTVPRTRTRRFGPRSFRVSGQVVWNSLPEDIRIPELTLKSFQIFVEKHIYFAKHMPSSAHSAFVTWLGGT